MSETKKNIPVVPIIIATVSLIVGFTIGLFYQKSKTPSFSRNGQFQQMGGQVNRGQGNPTGQRNPQMSGFKQTIGEITSIDDKSVTIKTADGGSKIILISDSTAINQSTSVAKTDLKVGSKVAVLGDQNTDGSITGKTINLNPATPEAIPTPAAKK
jgi:hypothetical protein